MQLPSIRPRAAFDLAQLIRDLGRVRDELSQIGSGTAREALLHYQRWSTTTADYLSSYFELADVERIMLSQRHWVLHTLAVADNGPAILDLVRAERARLERELTLAIEQLGSVAARWNGVSRTTKLLMPDTNVYCHNDAYFDDIDWLKLAGSSEARLLIPMAVVRELDRHKRTSRQVKVSDNNDQSLRTRARVTSRRIREAFGSPEWVVRLQPRGAEAELLLDEPAHRPDDDSDAEIIDRALAVKELLGRDVTIITGDGGMQFQASVAGLGVINLYEAGH